MQRRIVIALVSVTLLATVVATALVFNAPAAVRLTERPGEANHVALYQNGLASVALKRSFESVTAETTLVFALPPTAVFDSLTIEGPGVVVREIRSALSQTSGIHPGDVATVHVEGASYHGTVQAIEAGKIALSTPTGITYVEVAKATAIEVERALTDAATPGSIEARALVLAAPGVHNVTVSYLVNGPGWTPSYRLDADSGALVFFATLTASDDWRGVTLDLYAGTPHLVYRPVLESVRAYDRAEAAFAGAPSYDASFAPSAPMGELRRYHYDGAIDLARGESTRLVLTQGSASIERHYLEARAGLGWGGERGSGQDVQVLEKLELRNDLTEPLPSGVVRTYRGGEFVGEDMLPALPVGDSGNVTLATASEVKARVVLVENSASPSSDRYVYELTLRNLRSGAASAPADVRGVLDYPTYRTTLIAKTPADGQASGGSVAWNRVIEAGGSATFRIEYETLRYG